MNYRTMKGLFDVQMKDAEEKLSDFSLSAMMGDREEAINHLAAMYYYIGRAVGILEGYECLVPESVTELEQYEQVVDFEERANHVVETINQGIE